MVVVIYEHMDAQAGSTVKAAIAAIAAIERVSKRTLD